MLYTLISHNVICELHHNPTFKEMKTGYQRDICTPKFIAVLFTIAKIQKVLMDEWIKKWWCVHTPHEKKGNPSICDNMDGLWGHNPKWGKSDRELLYDVTCMWSLKKLNL